MARSFNMKLCVKIFIFLLVLESFKCFQVYRNFIVETKRDKFDFDGTGCGMSARHLSSDSNGFCVCYSLTPIFYEKNNEFCFTSNTILQIEECQEFLSFFKQRKEVTLSTPCKVTSESIKFYLRNKMDGKPAFWDASFSENIKSMFVQLDGTSIKLGTTKLKSALLKFEYTCNQTTTCNIIKIGGEKDYPFDLGIPITSSSVLTTSVRTTQVATSTASTTMLPTPATATLTTTSTIVPSMLVTTSQTINKVASSTSNQKDITRSTKIVPSTEITPTTLLISSTRLTSSVQTISSASSALPVSMTTHMKVPVESVAPTTSMIAPTQTPVDTNTGEVSESDDNKMTIIIPVVVGGGVILLLVLIFILCRRSRRLNKQHGTSEEIPPTASKTNKIKTDRNENSFKSPVATYQELENVCVPLQTTFSNEAYTELENEEPQYFVLEEPKPEEVDKEPVYNILEENSTTSTFKPAPVTQPDTPAILHSDQPPSNDDDGNYYSAVASPLNKKPAVNLDELYAHVIKNKEDEG